MSCTVTPGEKKIVFVDVETDGLIRRGKHASFPHIVQLSYMVTRFHESSGAFEISMRFNSLIKMPEGVTIDPAATEVHGITTEMANEQGVSLKEVYDPFLDEASSADYLVAHNTDFDLRVLRAELERMVEYNLQDYSMRRYPKRIEACKLSKMMSILNRTFGLTPENKDGDGDEDGIRTEVFCTMKESTDVCRLPNPYIEYFGSSFKFPTLSECFCHFFGFEPINMHDAETDVFACMAIFFMLKYGRHVCRESPELLGMFMALHPANDSV